MPTLRQKRLAKELILNEIREPPLQAKDLLVNVGYRESVATTKPGEIIASVGVQEAVKEVRRDMRSALAKAGVDENKVAKKISQLLDSEESYKAVAAGVDFALKVGVGGGYAPEKSQNLNVDVKVDSKDLDKHDSLREEYEAKLRQSYLEE